MQCTQNMTAKELLDWARMIDQWCSKKLDRINRILRNFYLDTVDIPYNFIAQPIVSTGLHTIQTEFPVYKIFGFFGNGCNACYIDQDNKCCGPDTSMLKMYQVDRAPQIGQYQYKCDTEILANIPGGLKNGYFVYSAWPIKVTSINDEIKIHPTMRSGLEYFVEKFYAEMDKDMEVRAMAKQNYEDWGKKIKDATDNPTFSIGLGISVNAPFYKN